MKKKIFSILFALVLVCSFSLVTAVPAVAQAEWYVDDSATGANDGSSWDDAFITIGAAITVAGSGDTINVAAGMYTEHVVIDTQLTVKGANYGVNPVTNLGDRQPESIIDATGVDPGNLGLVLIDEGGTGTIFDGFTVQPAAYASVQATVSSTISNNIVDGARRHAIVVGPLPGGAYPGAANNITIMNNLLTSGKTSGIYIWTASNCIVSGNKITGYTNYPAEQWGAISFFSNCQNNIITHNTIVDNVGAGISFLIPAENCSGNEIHYNTIDGNMVGVRNIARDAETHPRDAINNWWGTAVESEIQAMVQGNVVYSPFALAPFASPDVALEVDGTWVGEADGSLVVLNDKTYIIGTNAFATIKAAINAALSGDTINVAAGLYNERLTISDSLDLRGAQYGEDPTPAGARTTPADESVITEARLGDPDPDVLIDIANGVSGVTIDGFTLIGDPTFIKADTSVIRCGGTNGTADDITISNNIIDGKYGVIYKGGDTLAVHQNRMVVNKNGVVVQPNAATDVAISKNVITLGSTPAGDESAIYMTGCSESSVTGNTATGFIHNAALAGSHLDHLMVSGNKFIGNAAGISIWGTSTFITITDNVLSNSLVYAGWGDSGCGICIKGADIDITRNEIRNNGDIGVKIDRHLIDTVRVTISYNNIVDNTNYGVWVSDKVTEPIDATNNWWNHPSGPSHSPGYGDPVSGNVLYDPWLLEPFDPEGPPPVPFDKTLALNIGWTLVSTDNWIDPASAVGEDVVLAFNYIPGQEPGEGWSEVDPAAIVPVNALYVKTDIGGALGFDYSGGVPIESSKDLVTGWNLISSATIDNAKAILSPLCWIDVGDEQGVGLATLVSQGDYNQHTDSFTLATLDSGDWDYLEEIKLNPFDGYWVYMNAAKSFGVVPGAQPSP
ncbi:hypothetical protein ES703_21238 [subsurface metagenome]